MCTYVDEYSQHYKMQRILLNSLNPATPEAESIDTTPLRGSTVRFPRFRLLDKDFLTENVTKPRVFRSNDLKSSSQSTKINLLKTSNRVSSDDRFITCKYSVDAANYLLTKKGHSTLEKNQIDVFTQVNSLSVKWRKKFMHQLMVKENVIPGVRQKQVLRGSHLSLENKLPGNLAGQSKELWDEEYFEDGMWKSKPRRKPLIGIMDSILDMPGFHAMPRHRLQLIDWSSTNMIAAVIEDMVTFYDIVACNASDTLENVEVDNVCSLKWNNAGNKVALCSLSSEVKLLCVHTQKILWTASCKCKDYNIPSYVRSICWSMDDKYIVTGCTGLISVYSAQDGTVVKSTVAHLKPILIIAFSSNCRYLASSSLDLTVRIFLWPSLKPFLDISYYEPIRALAWHPYETGVLCIGGGMGDASLSLWNVNKLNPVSYRHVQFHGIVENLAWNKHSAELVVHWSYWKGRNRYTVMPVLASLDRIVDVIPVDKESRVSTIMWNPDQTQLATQYAESLSMWNFFGNESQYQVKSKKHRSVQREKIDTKCMTFKEFNHFNIR